MEDLMTVKEFVKYLRLSRAQAYVKISRSEIPYTRLGLHRVVIRKTDLEK